MRLSPENSPFEIIGVSEKATDEEVRQAYRRVAMRYHPDRNDSEQAEEQFKRVQLAYSLIKDETSRRKVANILHMYRTTGYTAGVAPGAGPTPRGHKQLDPSFFAQAARGEENPGFAPGRVAVAEFLFSVYRAFRLERIPFKMLVFVPLMLVFHWLEGFFLEPVLVFHALWQGFLGAFLTDVLLQVAATTNRYRLRLLVNRYCVWGLVISALLLVTTAGTGEIVYTHYGFNADVVRAIAVMGISLSFYSWFVFCFLFQKHHPTWENACVWFGIAGALYFSFFVLT